jgi:hypothetical protein
VASSATHGIFPAGTAAASLFLPGLAVGIIASCKETAQ